jgi:Xaa-Pro aminopeptidase
VAQPPLEAPSDPLATPAARRDALRSQLGSLGATAMLITGLPNMRYLSGFSGSSGALIVTAQGRDSLVTDFRYAGQVREEVDPSIGTEIHNESALSAARKWLARENHAKVVFESRYMSVAEWTDWKASDGAQLEAVTGWVVALRMRKSEPELMALRRAAAVADEALAEVLGMIRPGITELELAAKLDTAMIEHGSEGSAFETIVQFGEHSARPHARPTHRKLARGEVVLFDFGAIVGGYASDMSRTVACGRPDHELESVYAIVLEAQRTALDGLRAGMSGRDADALGRDVIEAAGYGPQFGHSLGHGIGLEVHEPPGMSRLSEWHLETDTVVTVEPGIYIEELGGVRIEDVVRVGCSAIEVLTSAPKDEFIVL